MNLRMLRGCMQACECSNHWTWRNCPLLTSREKPGAVGGPGRALCKGLGAVPDCAVKPRTPNQRRQSVTEGKGAGKRPERVGRRPGGEASGFAREGPGQSIAIQLTSGRPRKNTKSSLEAERRKREAAETGMQTPSSLLALASRFDC